MPLVDEEPFFHIDEKITLLTWTDKGIQAITRSGEDPDFFVLPDIGIQLAEIDKNVTDPEQKLQQRKRF